LLTMLTLSWLLISWWAFTEAKHMFIKYSKYDKLENLDHKFDGLYRNDYQKWNQRKIIIGCFIILPFRVLSFISLLSVGLFFSFLLKIFG
jgi:hypothetical protein